jgi:RHS repeat-associated protein
LDCSCLNSILNSATSITGRQLYNGLGELARHRLTSPHPTQGGELLESVEHFLFAPNGQVLHLTAENAGGTATDVIWVDNLPVAQLVASYDAGGLPQGTPALTYLHPDHLGSPRLGTNAARQVTWRWESEAFGQNTPNVPMGSAIVRLRLPGQIDLNIGLLAYNYYRTYDPLLGRYLESDPIGVEGGTNSYTYVANDPLGKVDPSGLDYLVIAGGQIPGSLNFPGHVAGAVTGGGVYSYGNDTPLGGGVADYIRAQSEKRNQVISYVRRTPEQDARILAFYRQYPEMNGVGKLDNCALRTSGALRAGGVPIEGALFPGQLSRQVGSLPETRQFYIPQGGPIPAELLRILPGFERP